MIFFEAAISINKNIENNLSDYTSEYREHNLRFAVTPRCNTDDNGSQKPKAESNANLYRTLSLAASASAKRHSSHSLGSCLGPFGSRNFFGVFKLWLRSRG